eukprot:14123575-Alexandrium_andersonii.AAC.1
MLLAVVKHMCKLSSDPLNTARRRMLVPCSGGAGSPSVVEGEEFTIMRWQSLIAAVRPGSHTLTATLLEFVESC